MTGTVSDKKKLLGLCIEKEGDNCIAIAPKCYTLWCEEGSTVALKVKGVQNHNDDVTYDDYVRVLSTGSIKTATNSNFQVKDGVMSRITVHKNALTCTHTKMRVLENQSCAPFL